MNLDIVCNYIVCKITNRDSSPAIRTTSCGDLVKSQYGTSNYCNLHFSSRLKEEDIEEWIEFLGLCGFKFTYQGRITDPALLYITRSAPFNQVKLDYDDYLSPKHAMIAYTALRYLVWMGCEELRHVCLALHRAYPEWEPLKCLYYCHYIDPTNYEQERALVPLRTLFKPLTIKQFEQRVCEEMTQHNAFCPPIIVPAGIKFEDIRNLAHEGRFDTIDEILNNTVFINAAYQKRPVLPLHLSNDGTMCIEDVNTGEINSTNIANLRFNL